LRLAVNCIDMAAKKKYSYSMTGVGNTNEIQIGQFPTRKISRREFIKLAAGAAVGLVLPACVPAGRIDQISTPILPTETKMPDHAPLSIVEQTIDEPVTIPTGDWDIDFVFQDKGVSTVEDGYRQIKNTQVFNNNLEGVIIDSPERNLVIIYTNGLAFDRRGNINGLPVPWAEDRCVMGTPDKIKAIVDNNHLEQNKHVIMVKGQTYGVPGGAEWEIAAFGPGIQPQRFIQTMSDMIMKPVAP